MGLVNLVVEDNMAGAEAVPIDLKGTLVIEMDMESGSLVFFLVEDDPGTVGAEDIGYLFGDSFSEVVGFELSWVVHKGSF
jgi:hypothetical protein